MKEILMKVVPPLNGKGLGPKPPILPLVETGVFQLGCFNEYLHGSFSFLQRIDSLDMIVLHGHGATGASWNMIIT